jgi:hypothetical protein
LLKSSYKTSGCVAAACGLACWLAAAPALARSGHVENRCSLLTPEAYEELDARVLLLLSVESSRPLPAVVCSGVSSYVEWDGDRFAITGRASIVDEVVDIVEAQLHGEQRRTEADPKTIESAAIAAGQPVLDGGADPPPRVRTARGGGIAIGIETELPSSSIASAMGPTFDFAARVGPVMLGGREALRFSVQGHGVSFMDFQALVANGAPFDPDEHVGVVLRFGAEWMEAYPGGSSGQAVAVPITAVGLRLANSYGLVGLWFGVDAHFRLSPLALHTSSELSANDVGASFTLGVAFVDWMHQ